MRRDLEKSDYDFGTVAVHPLLLTDGCSCTRSNGGPDNKTAFIYNQFITDITRPAHEKNHAGERSFKCDY